MVAPKAAVSGSPVLLKRKRQLLTKRLRNGGGRQRGHDVIAGSVRMQAPIVGQRFLYETMRIGHG